jgi:hypothetical protein
MSSRISQIWLLLTFACLVACCGGNVAATDAGAGSSHTGGAGAGVTPDARAAGTGGTAEAGSPSTVEDSGNHACGESICAVTEFCAEVISDCAPSIPSTVTFLCVLPDSGRGATCTYQNGGDTSVLCVLECV